MKKRRSLLSRVTHKTEFLVALFAFLANFINMCKAIAVHMPVWVILMYVLFVVVLAGYMFYEMLHEWKKINRRD